MAEEIDPDLEINEYASPPCYAHELSSEYGGQAEPEDSWSCVLRWRKAERQRLIEERLAIAAEERSVRSSRIASRLDLAIGKVSGRIVSGYWPFRGEPDLRNWAITIIERGGRIALPVVIRKGWPLEFRIWSPGDPLERGVWNILVPSRGPSVIPDVVIAPVVGFDRANYRLGYGGGFFDRTLAAMQRRPLAIGVGYAGSRLETIRPQPHDIAMDAIVTD
ncbi:MULTISPECIES: 5-formyltetrahydrofolate cyclo-ligase [unclassified Mesorhizobium]|uniref:5-formyltetrahydrofolate cyclo-ligase n=1 Tax=unclassified Mesorhizobium TaxID=325217 RepID=UPI00112C00CD|nr:MULTISPECIES: 5-formyltetrahydrofolate cyclo-ligase [unclassified Mesorhizobium]MBZ9811326.1 5-formyltetrahydrofolate cyclo-ligase [Mesorhizobium sp. ESP-6-2]TPM25894.1 5-formyltetrahydrofolate cyclo-ligase [Mesorhizobium sp. B2-2-2]